MTNTRDNPYVSFALGVLELVAATTVVLSAVWWFYVKDLAVINMHCM